MFKKNVGTADRVIRVLVGLALIGAYFAYPTMAYGWVLLVLAAIALATAAMSSCLVYTLLGIRTCQLKES